LIGTHKDDYRFLLLIALVLAPMEVANKRETDNCHLKEGKPSRNERTHEFETLEEIE
jgi:hypothetical protein